MNTSVPYSDFVVDDGRDLEDSADLDSAVIPLRISAIVRPV